MKDFLAKLIRYEPGNLGGVITPEIAFVIPITPPLLNVFSSAPMQMLARTGHVSVWLDTLRTGQKA